MKEKMPGQKELFSIQKETPRRSFDFIVEFDSRGRLHLRDTHGVEEMIFFLDAEGRLQVPWRPKQISDEKVAAMTREAHKILNEKHQRDREREKNHRQQGVLEEE